MNEQQTISKNSQKFDKNSSGISGNIIMSDLETSAIVLPGIINTAMKHGVDIAAILQKFGISLLDLENIAQSTINLKLLHAIVNEIEKASQFPAISLRTGEEFGFEYLPHLKTYLMSSSTLREVYQAICRIGRLISPILILTLVETEDDAKIVLLPDAELSYDDERHYVEMLFSTIKTTFSRLLTKDCPTKSVHFRHSDSRLLSIYKECFQCSIALEAPKNEMIFDISILDVPLSGGSPEIHLHAEQLLIQQLTVFLVQKGLVQRITRIMEKHKSLLAEPIEKAARCLNMSSRTLQRRLTEENTSFIELKDQIRFKLAVTALKSKKSSIEQISEEIGFSDRHSFTRAFKRWSGVSPSAFQKKDPK